jgi:hypothetical protein
MARFDFTVPDEETEGPAVGVGEAADGRIRAVIAADGRLRDLTISPQVLAHTRGGGTVLDSRALAGEITHAVNVAMDDLVRRRTLASVPNPAELKAELSHVKSDVDRALNDVRTELERAERRIADR